MNLQENTAARPAPSFVRHSLLGCLALLLMACGSSGSKTLIPNETVTSPNEQTQRHATVKHAIPATSIASAREKFTGATELSLNAAQLASNRLIIIRKAGRYSSTGALLARTTDADATPPTVEHVAVEATCAEGSGPTRPKCVFGMDGLRNAVTNHLGLTNEDDQGENDVGFLNSSFDREPIMYYKDVALSQVRGKGTDTKDKAGDDPDENAYEYVGYDGMLIHSMFFVGIHKFFDDDEELMHVRLGNASIGKIYDQESDTTGIQNPNLSLTGTGVMVGAEIKQKTLENHLVQGDVAIDYDHTDSTVDITVTGIKRLLGTDPAWYAASARTGASNPLKWSGLSVENSKFTATGSGKKIQGSFYGTPSTSEGDDPDNGAYEIGAAFHHIEASHATEARYSIFGAFGSKLSPPETNGGGS